MKKKKPSISFSKLPEWKQRVKIAKDVIIQLKQKKLIAEGGVFVRPYEIKSTYINHKHSQINNLINKKIVACNVCAKGSLFMAHIMKTNHCTLMEARTTGNYSISKRLTMFSQEQLNKIEQVFEGYFDNGSKEKGNKFFKRYLNEHNRLIAIMKNIIKNKGEFIP